MNESVVYFRLPYEEHFTAIKSKSAPAVLNDITEADGRHGFIIAPFVQSSDSPIVFIEAEEAPQTFTITDCIEEQIPLTQDTESMVSVPVVSQPTNEAYPFEVFHDAVADGRFGKLVLARQTSITATGTNAFKSFQKACHDHPHAMVMLWSTPQTGTWIVATPEVLVRSEGTHWHTMALAGTMARCQGLPEWSEKNQQEQHIVEQYITEALTPISSSIAYDGPHTVRAGNLIHLKTDFRFTLKEGATLSNIISRLHPTPAVCGIPQKAACQFILENEHTERQYYSGYAGPVGLSCGTHLYVSLRCARLFANSIRCFAGGGIMPGSQRESEWKETESKMSTIRQCLVTE